MIDFVSRVVGYAIGFLIVGVVGFFVLRAAWRLFAFLFL